MIEGTEETIIIDPIDGTSNFIHGIPHVGIVIGKIINDEITDGIIKKTKRRFNWLLLNLFTAFLATWVISLFGATIEQMVALAFLMPIVASMGGNAGMQTLAVTVRAIATNDLTENNFAQNIFKEFSIGILNGIIFALISAFVVQLWFNDTTLSLIISIFKEILPSINIHEDWREKSYLYSAIDTLQKEYLIQYNKIRQK